MSAALATGSGPLQAASAAAPHVEWVCTSKTERSLSFLFPGELQANCVVAFDALWFCYCECWSEARGGHPITLFASL